MVAFPVQVDRLSYPVPTSQGIFEQGDHIYITTPVRRITPSDAQIEEFAFSNAVKKRAPNDNIVWFAGQYVEADKPNANGAQWTAKTLKVKSLTPMLMPVTVMHDPRTAVGTIADVKHVKAGAGVERDRIDTVLALWAHRFPEVVNEAEDNSQAGTLMQSMECYSPWYECSECGQVFHKLPGGVERANWCEHLRASSPNGGSSDWLGNKPYNGGASRVLGDVVFTGTGLIFGTRGAHGAYSEAHLEHFQSEVAAAHATAHLATASPLPARSTSRMGLVQIEDTELAHLRKERDDARAAETAMKAERDAALTAKATAESAAEAAEVAKTAAETAKAAALEEQANQVTLKDTRWNALGEGFTAKLGDFTKGRLQEQAKTLSDEDWDGRLKELEETAGVKRDAAKDGVTPPPDETGKDGRNFTLEEIASANGALNGGGNNGGGAAAVSEIERSSVIGSLAGAFRTPTK
jgi:hypothetical protein